MSSLAPELNAYIKYNFIYLQKRKEHNIVCIREESGEVDRELTLYKWRIIRPERRKALRGPRPNPLSRQKTPEYPRELIQNLFCIQSHKGNTKLTHHYEQAKIQGKVTREDS